RDAFIDKVYADELFQIIFKRDHDGRKLCQVPTIQELVQQYREKIVDACKQLFISGQEEYQKRLTEETTLRECIEHAKNDSKLRALEAIEAYKEKKNNILKKLDEIQQDTYPELTEALLSSIRQHIHDLWNDLMGFEISLVDQLEDVINEFGRNLEEKISNFGETVQVCFSKVRESAVAFNERLAELTLTYTERIAKTDGPQDESYAVYADRDFVVNALSNSRDTQVNVIDQTEEGILKSIQAWFNGLMEDLHEKEEYGRHTNRVTEINLYIDAQYVDLETMD
uniref:DHC_N1 domain-containing protein n=1 Tax=Mesocestoides corti TaxID=53468 RepID=A0A5K3FGX2_MESCO